MAVVVMLIVGLAIFTRAAPTFAQGQEEANGRRFTVNGDRGQTISMVLERARPGDTIVVRGTCNETIVITKNRLTLRGADSATIDGGDTEENVVTIEGARDVTICGIMQACVNRVPGCVALRLRRHVERAGLPQAGSL